MTCPDLNGASDEHSNIALMRVRESLGVNYSSIFGASGGIGALGVRIFGIELVAETYRPCRSRILFHGRRCVGIHR